ncbi:MAG: hypothetical protein JSV62_03280 [Promethearchaeota archaeon]|nr:MAG: hypothetical protein JSV62_03280 [Candidatus Lokiarchaeota archaeon]
MKKAKIGGLSLLGFLLFFSFVNVSNAVPPSYVGVNIGNSFTWTASANVANINATGINLFGEANWTLIYGMLDYMIWNMTGMHIDSFFGGAMKMDIANMTPEVPMGFPPGVNGVGLYIDGFMSIEPGVWMPMMTSAYPSLYILDPTNINASNFMYFLGFGMPAIVPKGLPWNNIATWYNAMLAVTPPVYNNITMSGLTDGLEFTVLGEFMELMINMSGVPLPLIPTIPDAIGVARWNANGVFSYGSLSMGGLTLVTASLSSEEAIPGFFIPITIGLSAIAAVGIIVIIRKKKKII